MSELLNKISELTANRDVEISINIKIGQDSVKTTGQALKLLTEEVSNVVEIFSRNKSKSKQESTDGNDKKE